MSLTDKRQPNSSPLICRKNRKRRESKFSVFPYGDLGKEDMPHYLAIFHCHKGKLWNKGWSVPQQGHKLLLVSIAMFSMRKRFCYDLKNCTMIVCSFLPYFHTSTAILENLLYR